MRIRCFGVLDEELPTTEKLVELMHQVENGEVGRPEIEIVDGEGQAEKIFHIGALFREGDGECVGWLISTRDNAKGKTYAYCMNSHTPTPQHLTVLFCGSPEIIHPSAVLQLNEVTDFVQKLIDGTATQSHSWKRLIEIISE
ncbi:hypothetical protein AB1K70_19580 [Bremerella sp. JC770]|uniref:hypothetical protein n=1 Tax=Bremerella sp. JC770 TaxID=3232137 RepID=UPI00345AE8B3